MKPGKTLHCIARRNRTAILAVLFAAAAAFGMIPIGSTGTAASRVADAQNFGQRVVQGTVMDGDKPVAGATIFLKNLKTRNLKSYTSIADGSFRFAQVGMIDDYEVWAELGKKKSAVHGVSSFDSRKQVEFELKLK